MAEDHVGGREIPRDPRSSAMSDPKLLPVGPVSSGYRSKVSGQRQGGLRESRETNSPIRIGRTPAQRADPFAILGRDRIEIWEKQSHPYPMLCRHVEG